MATDKKFKVIIDVNSKEIKKDFNTAKNAAKDFTTTTTVGVEKVSTSFASFSSTLAGGTILAGATAAMLSFGKSALSTAADMEQLEIQFETLTGSAETAKEILQDLVKFAADTPFEIPGLTVATKQLIQAQVPQEELINTLRRIGDISAVTGAQIENLSIAFSRMSDRGAVITEELNKFDEAGAGLARTMADNLNITVGDLRKRVEKGTISFQMFSDAIEQVTNEGGRFAGGMIKQTDTLTGKISNLDDAWQQFQISIAGGTLTDATKKVLDFAIAGVNAATGLVKAFSEPASELQNIRKEAEELGKELDVLIAKNQEAADLKEFGFKVDPEDVKRINEIIARQFVLEEQSKKLIKAKLDEKDASKQASDQAKAEAAVLRTAQEGALKRIETIGIQREEALDKRGRREVELVKNAMMLKAITEQEGNRRIEQIQRENDQRKLDRDKKKKEREKSLTDNKEFLATLEMNLASERDAILLAEKEKLDKLVELRKTHPALSEESMRLEAQLRLETKKELDELEIEQEQEKWNRVQEIAQTAAQGLSTITQTFQTLLTAEIQADNARFAKQTKEVEKKIADVRKKQAKASTQAEKDRLQRDIESLEQRKEIIGKAQQEEAKKNFESQKKINIANALINGGLAITNILAKHAGNPITAGILTALTTGLITAQVSTISSQQFPGFERGGIMNPNGSSLAGDNNLARFNDGEMFINKADQASLFSSIRRGDFGGANPVQLEMMERQNQLLEIIASKDLNIDGEKLNNELNSIESRAL